MNTAELLQIHKHMGGIFEYQKKIITFKELSVTKGIRE
jgi:hypothetical protein